MVEMLTLLTLTQAAVEAVLQRQVLAVRSAELVGQAAREPRQALTELQRSEVAEEARAVDTMELTPAVPVEPEA